MNPNPKQNDTPLKILSFLGLDSDSILQIINYLIKFGLPSALAAWQYLRTRKKNKAKNEALSPPSAYIHHIQFQFDEFKYSQFTTLRTRLPIIDYAASGVWIDVKFQSDNIIGEDILLAAYFYLNNGVQLIDYNNSYNTIDGKVAVSQVIHVPYQNTLWESFKLYIPYAELHLNAGRSDLFTKLIIFHRGIKIVETYPQYFFVTI